MTRECILPGSGRIGILGGGQLGRMLAQAAQTLGFSVSVFEPQAGCPAGAVAHREVNAPYTDWAQLRDFARGCDVLTYEFENIPTGPLRQLAAEGLAALRPDWRVLEIAQNRLREKTWLRERGVPHARFASVAAGGDLAAAIREVGLPCVVKTADFGYDGKGQLKLQTQADVAAAAAQFAGQAAVVEQWVAFRCELSVVVARGADGQARAFPVSENVHTNHILDYSILPARVPTEVQARAEALGLEVAEKLGVVGLIAVELFLTEGGELLVNELAPRTHNSGHYTLDACATSQFEQQVRAICGLPLGDTALRAPAAVMGNLLGDLWFGPSGERRDPDWPLLLADPDVKLHLYGKAEPRRGRKMGHFTVRGANADEALARAQSLKAALRR
ncbi:5-(carboxyamino)imidazole ribonucleotide synthase [Cephaloticoccus primus]|uniref:N5-carboxyaminoimidazole ribonucleotide synthase n=1 Tax=Cephaloticoccus primus TaxID=1548207 RepID=A0A139STK9_9BACT|nr:5-(carboxyamino)imidazole ribonucleotide synthase [Cephaloticoccus primus]KXU37927.1 5-(carboxyamino)imidazole ribonucleotide synthase [Cephaloticoccus primus]